MSKIEIAQKLQSGEIIERYKEHGNSMIPIIKSGQPVKLEPVIGRTLKVGDIVFCKVRGNYYTHLIKAIRGKQYQIGNNHGGINGWISKNSIFGIVTKVHEK
jgi:hypothetical protein